MDDNSKAKGERNDCVVRAIRTAFDVTYNEAHDFTRVNLFRKRKGYVYHTDTRFLIMINKGQKIFGKTLINMPVSQKTVLTFSRKFPKGNYLLLTSGHAIGISDGSLSDRGKVRKQRIQSVYKVI